MMEYQKRTNLKAEEFQRIREKLGLDREEFAEVFGLAGYKSVSNIENSIRNPSKLTIIFLRTLDAIPLQKAKNLIELMRRHGKIK
jgi:DNA-binding transcriptional regulator YiaG